MKYALQIAKIANIPIRLHWSFALLIAYIVGNAWYTGSSAKTIFLHSSFIVALFCCVLLHELGHALTAAYYKVKTTAIMLFPFGGVAFFERISIYSLQEFVIAFAGPLTNLVVAGLLYIGIFAFTPASVDYIGVGDGLFSVGHTFAERLMWANIFIALFNLIPAFPLDGGQMLRALLTHFFKSKNNAIKIQFFISLAIATLFLVYSYQQRAPEHLFFAWIIYFSSRKEWAKIT
jgi:Zn-dependent protease